MHTAKSQTDHKVVMTNEFLKFPPLACLFMDLGYYGRLRVRIMVYYGSGRVIHSARSREREKHVGEVQDRTPRPVTKASTVSFPSHRHTSHICIYIPLYTRVARRCGTEIISTFKVKSIAVSINTHCSDRVLMQPFLEIPARRL